MIKKNLSYKNSIAFRVKKNTRDSQNSIAFRVKNRQKNTQRIFA